MIVRAVMVPAMAMEVHQAILLQKHSPRGAGGKRTEAITKHFKETQLTSFPATAYHQLVPFFLEYPERATGARVAARPSDDTKYCQAGLLGSAWLYTDA
jgi:hypothetical protein